MSMTVLLGSANSIVPPRAISVSAISLLISPLLQQQSPCNRNFVLDKVKR
jgi:hypothetical protein